ncbi:MAG: SulP family inorganic anion transporter [Bdellovibrionaceae bacterium]|nr:SulP family inorganic anion transporter [Pseudobdellovibrionaceae bacterium]
MTYEKANDFLSNIKGNLVSGFIIFLVALPLSVGISVASGAPPSAGILSAIVGGILGSLISGSYVTINGAAAGLIVVILDAVNSLGGGDMNRGFRMMLAAVVIAGLIQIFLGLIRVGTFGLAVPLNALHGMMTSIGLTIIIKQLYILGGISPESHSTVAQLIELPGRIREENMEILLVGLACLGVVLVFHNLPRLGRLIPPSLAAVIYGYFLSLYVDISHDHFVNVFNQEYPVGPKYLLHVPESIGSFIQTPLFENVFRSEFYIAVLTIALVGSIESLLSTYAVDKLDPLKRTSNLNFDLISKGICNTLLGAIGGLPIISEIVRSSANVISGATQRSSNFFHGVFILIFIVLFPHILNSIPLTTFAAILIFVGYRLAQPSQLVTIYKSGKTQLLIFLFTILVTLSTDLLIGILAGTLLELAINMVSTKSCGSLFVLKKSIQSDAKQANIVINGPCVFTNLVPLKKIIEGQEVPNILVEFKNNYVDHSTKEILLNIKDQLTRNQKNVTYSGIDFSSDVGGH